MVGSIDRRTLLAASIAAVTLSAESTARAATGSLTWTEVTSAGTVPPARWDHSLAASDSSRQLVLFGGRDAGGASFGDTWLFSRRDGEWLALAATGPSARFGHAIAMDSEANLLYLFGGQFGETFFNDLWLFDVGKQEWRLVHDGAGTAPLARYGTSMVLSADGNLVMSHGFTFSGRFNDTWAFNLSDGSWTDISPASETERPLNRCLHEAVWDSKSDVMLLYGGCSSGYGPCPQDDLWSFNPTNATWTQLISANPPAGRMNPGLVYDRGRTRALLVGGLTDAGPDNSSWSLVAGNEPVWTAHAVGGPAPTPRYSHDICVTGPNLYLFGGMGSVGPTSDLWVARLDD